MFKALTLLFSLSLVGCGGELAMKSIDDGPDGSARNFAAIGPIHSPGGWRETVRLYVADDAPEIIVEATIKTISAWNRAAGRNLMTYEGRRAPQNVGSLFSVLDDNITMIYFEKNWSKNTAKADYVLGTTVWENGGRNNQEIQRGDIILNGENFFFQDALSDVEDEDRIYDIADAESVLLHEAGHLLGLDHVEEGDDPKSVMHATTPIGWQITKRELSAGDAELISKIYSGGI